MKNSMICSALMVALIATGCTNSKPKSSDRGGKNTIDVSGIKNDKNLSRKEKAEQLALAAEELFVGNPAAFMYADMVASTALSFDSENKRAQLYKALLSPFMKFRGIWKRLEPLAARDAEYHQQYLARLAEAKAKMPLAVASFLEDGKDDIKTEAQLQAYIDELASGYDDMRVFFKANRSLQITLTYVSSTFAFGVKDQFKLCDVVEKDNGDIEYVDCSMAQKTQVKLDVADNVALELFAGAMNVYMALFNAYNFGDIESAVRAKQDRTWVKQSEIYALLAGDPNFGKLRNPTALSRIGEMGLDGLKATRFAMANRETLCPTVRTASYVINSHDESSKPVTQEEYQNHQEASRHSYYHYDPYYHATEELPRRPGYLLSRGVCVNDTTSNGRPVDDILSAIEKAILGETVSVPVRLSEDRFEWSEQNGQWNEHYVPGIVKTYGMKPAAFIQGQLKDIKALRLRFDDCDHPIHVQDSTLAGIFPNGDFNILLKERAEARRCFEFYYR